MEKNLTSGSVLKNIVYFSLPYLLSYFLQTLYGMADLFIIGQFEGGGGHDRCLNRQPGHAHAHGYDRGTCDGNDRQHRSGDRSKRQEEGGKCHRKYGHTVCYGGGRHACHPSASGQSDPSGYVHATGKPWQVPRIYPTICLSAFRLSSLTM